MTSSIRMFAAAAIPILLGLIGYVFTLPPANSGLADRLAAWPEISPPVDYSNSADRIIGDIAGMYLFGRTAEMLAEAENANTESGNEAEAPGLNGISLIAVAALDDNATAIVDLDDGGIMSVTVGQVLSNDWTVESISRDQLTAVREGEVKTLFLPSTMVDN